VEVRLADSLWLAKWTSTGSVLSQAIQQQKVTVQSRRAFTSIGRHGTFLYFEMARESSTNQTGTLTIQPITILKWRGNRTQIEHMT
jgi:hypothetical protein